MKHLLSAAASVCSTGWVRRYLLALLAVTTFTAAAPALAGRTNGGIAAGFPPAPTGVAPVVPPQFDITGFMQDATVDATMCPSVTDLRLKGGTVTLNGQKIIVPCNTILQMPAFATTWADLFSKTMVPVGTPVSKTGLALSDTPAPLPGFPAGTTAKVGPAPSHEIHVVGNVINGKYIAGLIFISQQSMNGGQGVISCIDYSTGELQVGGTPVAPGAACPKPVPLGVARVRMNDPVGRYGIVHGGTGCLAARTCDVEEAGYDPRYTADTDNPTMHSTLGFPVCIPRVNPFVAGAPVPGFPSGTDLLCPQSNRPLAPNCKGFDPKYGLPGIPAQVTGYCTTFVMDPPGTPAPINPNTGVAVTCPGPGAPSGPGGVPAAKPCPTDPMRAAPLEIGDTIGFHGTLKTDAAGTYMSAHTIDANLGIYTTPHTQPAYVFMEGMLVGTGGQPIGGLAQEATGKVSWEGFATDPTELVDFYSLQQDPVTGEVTQFFLGTQDPCCTPLGRFRTPANNNGAFGEPTRNYRAVSRNVCNTDGATPVANLCELSAAPLKTANDLVAGQYTLPNFEYIFAENLTFGAPLVPNNFQDLPFLYCGSGPIDGPGSGTTIVRQLDPAPWAPPMVDPVFRNTINGCSLVKTVAGSGGGPAGPVRPTIASATASPSTVTAGSGGNVTLTVVASDPNTPATALTFAWTGPAGVTLANPNTATPSFTVPSTAGSGTLSFTVTVTSHPAGAPPAGLSSTATVAVNVNPAGAALPVANAGATQTVVAGTPVTLLGSGSSAPVTFSWTQVGGPAVTLNSANTLFPTFTAPAGPATLSFLLTATNSSVVPALRATSLTTVIVNPDFVTIAAPTWDNRKGKGKITISATSTVSPGPADMTMTAIYSNSTLPANVPGSVANPISTPLTFVSDPVTCVPAATCWTVLAQNVIVNSSVSPAVLVPPDSITVRSSLGGVSTITGAAITVRAFIP